MIALPQIRCKKIPQELALVRHLHSCEDRNASSEVRPCWCAPTMLAHEVSVRALDALTQLQETATSGTPERYLMILFTRDNPFPSRSRQSGRGWRIALVKTLNKQTASRSPASRSNREPLQRRARVCCCAYTGLYPAFEPLRFNSLETVDGARSTIAAICRIDLPSACSRAISILSSMSICLYLFPIATP